jgi:hypothetical protein
MGMTKLWVVGIGEVVVWRLVVGLMDGWMDLRVEISVVAEWAPSPENRNTTLGSQAA